MTAMFLGLVACCCPELAGDPRPENPTIAAIGSAIRESHRAFFRTPGGISIDYRVEIDQDPKNPILIWPKGLNGQLNVKWPRMRTRNEGDMVVGDSDDRLEWTVREAVYDFEKHASVAREGKSLGQVVNYRHGFSSSTLFTLSLLFYAESDQYYLLSRPLKTSKLLPDVLEQYNYKVDGEDMSCGVRCWVLRRTDASVEDILWIAPDYDYLVCKRETRDRVRRFIERTENTQVKKAAPNVWIPHLQTQVWAETGNPEKVVCKQTVRVTRVRTGDLADRDLDVILTKEIVYIEDQIRGIAFRNDPKKTDPFESALKRSWLKGQAVSSPYMVLGLQATLVILLGIIILFLKKQLSNAKEHSRKS